MKTKKTLMLVLMIFIISTLFTSCSKENSESSVKSQTSIIDGGTISQFEVVSLEFENLTLSQESYKGSINENEITLVRLDENKVQFMIDSNITLGEQILEIPALESKVKYNISATVLTKTVEKTIEDLSGKFEDYHIDLSNTSSTSDSDDFAKIISDFKKTFNELDEEGKKIIALTYQANKAYFDNLTTVDYSALQGKNKQLVRYEDYSLSRLGVMFTASALGVTASVWMAISGTTTLVGGLPFVISSYYFLKKMRDIGLEFVSRDNVFVVDFRFNNYVSDVFDERPPYNKKTENYIEFTNGKQKSINFNITTRGIADKDKNSLNSIVKSFFEATTTFNNVTEKLNALIAKVNTLPFTDIPLSEEITIGVSKNKTVTATEKIFGNLSVSVTDENLELGNVAFNNGKINMTISIKDETKVDDFVETTINYSYKDETNEFKSSIPIRVNTKNANVTCTVNNITDITSSTANITATLTNPDNATITEWGIVYATHNTPTVNDSKIVTDHPNTTTNFTFQLKDLTAKTAYYVKGYYTINNKTYYTDVQRFDTTDKETIDLSGVWIMHTKGEGNASFQFNTQGITFISPNGLNKGVKTNTYSLKNGELIIVRSRKYNHPGCSDVVVSESLNIKATYNNSTKRFEGYYSYPITGGKGENCEVHGSTETGSIVLYKKQ